MTNRTRNIIIIALGVLIALCIGITVWAVFFRDAGEPPITPDYPPQGEDEGQKPIEGDNSNKIESPTGGGGYNMTYNTTATACLSDGTVTLWYANPNASNQNVAILIMIDDMVVAKSELILPGNQITSLKLEDYAKGKLQAGGYDATLVVRAYDPVSGEKAMVEGNGNLTLVVTE